MVKIERAEPFPFTFDVNATALIVIDMQRDFIEFGGFGTALGNDVTPLQSIVPATARLIAAARTAGMPVIHTRECHVRIFPTVHPQNAIVQAVAEDWR